MRLELNNVIHTPGAVLPFAYTLDLSELDFYGEHPFAEPVEISGEVHNRAGLLELDSAAHTTLHLHCDSCGRPFTRALTVPVARLLAESLEREEDDDILPLDGSALELDGVMTDELIFALDTKNLCREDCKGRCPRCGADLNEGPCGCEPLRDPRLAVLAKLLKQDE